MERGEKQHYLISEELQDLEEPKEWYYDSQETQTSTQRKLTVVHYVIMMIFLTLVIGGIVGIARFS